MDGKAGNELAALAARIRRLEDIEAIRRLKAEYARSADPVHDVERMVGLFTEDGVLDIGEEYGVYEGKKALRDFLSVAGNIIPWAIHYMVSPVIDVADDGQSAKGTWYLWQLANMPRPEGSGLEPVWIAGVYHDDLVKVGGEWKFKRVTLRMQIMSPYSDGWVKTPWIGK